MATEAETRPPNRPGDVLAASEAAGEAVSALPALDGLIAPDIGWETIGDVRRIAGASVPLIRRYCDLGLIEFARDRYNRRVFRAGTAERVKQIKAERVAAAMRARTS